MEALLDQVKDCGWYWGPLPKELAERLLLPEPPGSFVVRDSSDPRYIFSLSFKHHKDVIRHVRIDHDHGNFSFASSSAFKAKNIVEFVESALEHSRSGRYLFFWHQRGAGRTPLRLRLVHPVSRFRQVGSLQHRCRYAIVRRVRRDLIPELPLPAPLIDYLLSPGYLFELPEHCDDESKPAG